METTSHRPSRVGFIGTGVMGRSMALHLVEAGYRVAVHNRTPAKARDVVDAGGEWSPTVSDAVREADFVISIVGSPDEVRQVYLGEAGAIRAARPGAVLIDMSTSQPSLAREIYSEAAQRGVAALDAPVSGGDVGARNATLSIMVGGDREAFDRATPILRAMGSTVVLQGPPGSGQHTKLCNQIAIASNMLGVVEALCYARAAGLDPMRVLESIGAGAAGSWSLANLYPRIVRGDLDPGFFVEHFLKDIRIARAEAQAMGIELPGLALAEAQYERVAAAGGSRQGTQALIRAYAESP